MRICHVTEYCHAGSNGGTERYILELSQGLSKRGIPSSICWLSQKHSSDSFMQDAVEIIPIKAPVSRIELPEPNFKKHVECYLFSRIKPDIIHFHTFGMAEAVIAQTAVQLDIPYAFTYHSPAWSCRRDTLLIWGQEPCDGEVRTLRCSACKLQDRLGGGSLKNYALTYFFYLWGLFTDHLVKGRLRRRTAFVKDTYRFRKALRNFLSNCVLNITCCNWSTPILLTNGAKQTSIFHCPQGVSPNMIPITRKILEEKKQKHSGTFVVGYIGRTTPVKGIHILLEAFRRMNHPDLQLKILGWSSGKFNQDYAKNILRQSEEDHRIEILPELPFNETLEIYKELSVLAIPSVWMETGPLVLFEAIEMGIPVLGSCRIGQLELLKEYGMLVHPNTQESWQNALEHYYQIFKKNNFIKRKNRKSIRSMKQVTTEMVKKYESLLANDPTIPSHPNPH